MFQAKDAFTVDSVQQSPAELWSIISPHYSVDEASWLQALVEVLDAQSSDYTAIASRASRMIEKVRESDDGIHMIDALLLQYSLDTREGILLMCLAEALMRIPDNRTADALIRDKLSVADWKKHLSQSDSLLVNASTWGLLLTGKVVNLEAGEDGSAGGVIGKLVNRMGEPVIRQAVNQAMKIMGRHFVLGRTISEALKNGLKQRDKGYTYSFDMLGESALTMEDARRYHDEYLAAIRAVASEPDHKSSSRAGISIKLSALHPRYEVSQKDRVFQELVPALLDLVREARAGNVAINMDAEEQDRHELFLEVFERVYRHPDCRGWGGLGLVIQAYGKRALPSLCWLSALAREQGDRIPVRLVKGAYWDSEIKLCQQQGLPGYPVYTRKEATDVAYLVCAKFLLSEPVRATLYPQFASHNAHTVASILTMAEQAGLDNKNTDDFEFQRLHGMGDALYNLVLDNHGHPVRIYAPVGSHKDLLPYLVRRLLENGANSSFVHRLVDAKTPIASLVQHPVETLKSRVCFQNDQIPLPPDIYGQKRKNSLGVNVDIESQWQTFQQKVQGFMEYDWHQGPWVDGHLAQTSEVSEVSCPYDRSQLAGHLRWSDDAQVDTAAGVAVAAFYKWNATPAEERAQCLERLADLLEDNREELVALCHREAGKTLHDAIDEVREAVDFCRYYANQARERFSSSTMMPEPTGGPTGESNELRLSGRGVFLCISPWNFPLAIFLGQVTAALAAGNTVIAKPAEQTGLIAGRAVELMLQAGIPGGVIQLLPGAGAKVGHQLVTDTRIAGVVFTGSTETARVINLALANRPGPIVPLIAETGGQNAMIVDSTALPEQVVKDVILSAFGSAGQRCSALRVLYVQKDIADRVISLLQGAMQELSIGNPSLHSTDIGPVIDEKARQSLQSHIERMKKEAKLLFECELPAACSNGSFVAPVAFEIDHIGQLEKEHFGPVLHVIRYDAQALPEVIDQINSTGYGLTLGIHSRNEVTATYIEERVKVGNIYINRNQTGAVVGVQPFGGQGLSGTGPKAGGPNYLLRFATEQTVSINTTAVGGNATLLSLGSESL
ncbi:bifunctional proline dehydrogenase/L-glutamate gamma-semialdehyde dehydrogenase PutA [Endozoicomonas elysicola]|uniref:Bifunctional protein PutA n=1 Tax=Endozoicomonas elysicola TaxID=305900 RepID=A0A081KG74_9GAMM|nr:bifunctional proline dehydrogenase/L-glutamate gamma-semialdehyde dehydrogenase PutA [Endozoicomonas elysicola]KEI73150.1 pyrroline-5-carboxylate dehydrogenase [Endozoicomonas elysicola]